MNFIMTIAASDNSGGAGVQQDIKTATNLNCWVLSAITGITVQDFSKVQEVHPIDSHLLKAQIEKNFESFNIKAVKIGAICSLENLKVIKQTLLKYKPKIVIIDPVFSPTSGQSFLKQDMVKCFCEELLPICSIITPNAIELQQIINNTDQTSAKELCSVYNLSIILTGGHNNHNGNMMKETIITRDSFTELEKKRDDLKYSHGTGCTFSTALACYLCNNTNINSAVKQASNYVSNEFKRINNTI